MKYIKRAKEYILKKREYVIPGVPVPWKRPGLKGKIFYDKQSADKNYYGCYMIKQHGNYGMFTGPLQTTITYLFPWPASLYKRPEGGNYHITIPDLDNCTKLVFDAITSSGVIWKDDRFVSSLITKKVYNNVPATHIVIEELE